MGKKKDDSDIKKWAIIATVVIVTLWAITFFIPYGKESVLGERGTFGDMFGAVNALFSGFAFAGIIITIILQSRELKLQREELADTREVFQEQSKLMATQQNDNTFFNLLNNHRQLIASLRADYDLEGYKVIDNVYESWKDKFQLYSDTYNNQVILDLELHSFVNFSKIIDSYPHMHTHYRELLHVYNFIANRLNNSSFYHETLKHSLTYQEKFIFETFYYNFPSERDGVNHDPQFYLDHNFVDFNTCKLPSVKAEVKGLSFRKEYLVIYSDSLIRESRILITWKNKDKLELIDVLSVDNIKNENHLKIDIEQYLENSRLDIGLFPLSRDIRLGDFRIIMDTAIISQGKIFNFLFEIKIETSKFNAEDQSTLYKIQRLEIISISSESYNKVKKTIDKSNFLNLNLEKLSAIKIINDEVEYYFNRNPVKETVLAKELMEIIKNRGAFPRNSIESQPLQDLLRDLSLINRLDLIPASFSVLEESSYEWYFKKN